MNRPLSNVVDITPQTARRWTCLVQVLENGNVQESKNKTSFRRLVLTDAQGTKLSAVIYFSHLRYFATTFSPYRRYYISNAVVTKTDRKYHISSYPFSWTLNNRTLVEELIEPIPVPLPCEFHFARFQDIHKYADTDNFQNVRAIVLRCFESKEQGSEITTRRDIVVVDEEKTPLLLTLWNEFDRNEGRTLTNIVDTGPMIFAMRVKVTTFNCLSLSTKGVSGIMINPPVTEPQMHRWYNENREELQKLVQMEAYKNPNLLLPYPKDENVISIATVTASLNIFKTAWIKGKITLLKDERSLWYSACANCQKALEADLTWIVTCPSCKMESEVFPMCRLPITINDNTETIHTILCTPTAKTFIPMSPMEIKEAEEHGIDVHETISPSIQQHTIVAFIRWYEVTFRGQTETRFNIVTAYKSSNTSPASVPAPQPKDANKNHSTAVKKQPSHVATQERPTKKAKLPIT